MQGILSLLSKVHEKGNRFIIEQLNKNGVKGLVPSHGDILITLYENKKLTMKEIADKIHRTKPTVTVLVNKLEKLKFVKREQSEQDNRYTYIVLTKKAFNFKPVFDDISMKLNNLLLKNLSKKDTDVLERLLKQIMK